MIPRLRTVAAWLAVAASCATSLAWAGGVFKCLGADGRTTFSDAPCAQNEQQHTVKAPPPPSHTGQVDVDTVCTDLNVRGKGYRAMEACMLMRTCASSHEPQACSVYCRDYPDNTIPGVKFGPVSAACLVQAKRLRGPSWVQSGERTMASAYRGREHEVLPYACLDRDGRAGVSNHVLCEPGTRSCTSPRTINGRLAPYAPLEELLAGLCRSPGAPG